jgi:DNA polymerase-3 subunit alpha
MNYVELHLHDHYSALDGLNTPEEYMVRAAELGMTHLAQTNHGTLSGHRDFQREAEKAGITPILGVEAYISATDRFDRRTAAKREDGTQTYNHIGLLAMNENGLRNLNVLMREAWTSGFYSKPRIDMDLLDEYNEDIVVLSGCLGGLLASALTTEKNNVPDYDRALKTAKHLKAMLGERFFIEVQGHNPQYINDGLFQLAEDTGTKPVITSDCHYARKEDLWVEDAMLILSTKPKAITGFDLSKSQTMDYIERYNYLYPERKLTFQEIEIYLRSAAEQLEMLEAQGRDSSAVTNTALVAKMVGDYPYYEALDLLPSPDENITDLDEELRRQVFDGLRERGLAEDPVYVERAMDELRTIKQMGFAVYFLILSDIVQWARKKRIFIGPGRGSGVSSLVNYSLFITNIDPIEYKLLFFRFLDPDRPDWPDVDIDFEVKRRYEVKEYANRKYGYTANIMTFNYFRGKSAIKAAASVFKIPMGEVNKATSTLQEDAEYSVLEVYETSEQTAEFRKKYPEVGKLAARLEGRIRGTGMHAGGTVLSKVPIEDYVPMETRVDPQDDAKDRVPLVAVDMRDAEKIGLIKMDFLGLNNLTVILEVLEEVGKMTQEEIYDIPLDDPKVYEMLSAGHTKGVFQCEGGPYTKLLVSMGGVDNFEDLVSSNALVRPGAAKSSIGENYVIGKNTGKFEYVHADAKYFTEETYGQILFQEQQMLLCTEVAGLTMREANIIRKAISKKILKDLVVWKPAFIEGAAKKIGNDKAILVWDDLEKSAEYAFNRAHSVGYSMISYWTAWFKVNYPVEYMTALMNHLSGSDTKTKMLFYLMEAKRMGIKVLLPHINASGPECRVENGAIRLGLVAIKGIAAKGANRIAEHAPYASYDEFKTVAGTKGSGINQTAVKALNAIGGAAFDDNPRTGNERDNFYEYLNIPAFESKDLAPEVKLQFRDLTEYTENETFVVCGMVYNIKTGPGWALVEYVDESGDASSFANQNIAVEKGKMYVMLISNNRILRFITTDDIIEGKGGAFGKYLEKDHLDLSDGEYRCIAYNTRVIRSGPSKGQKMIDATFTDADKNLYSAAVFSDLVGQAMIPCATASKVRVSFGESRRGGLVVKDIKS